MTPHVSRRFKDLKNGFTGICAERGDITTPLFDKAAQMSSEAMGDMILNEWRAVNVVLQSWELRSGYFRGTKPA